MNRSEAVRDVLHDRLQEDRLSEDKALLCVASLSDVCNHPERELARPIAEIQHAHHDLVRSTMHVHLDHENCLEVSMMEGPTIAVRELADTLMAQTGVRHGRLNVVPVDVTVAAPSHGHHGHRHHDHSSETATAAPHVRTSPKT
ncbi:MULTISPECIES: nickel-responsive transcriptional regulator NikR [Rhodopseudomonas]|uniref:nickel-responsive transcriptional regulator NikR n=1 Tax=Rhodopseudomonas TaxID=1073 RepID=UPI000A9EB2BF|nr:MULTISPECIES: nickel-responsive transcriptional regulator NikR [Rhodopseudomonas]MDF3811564.1 nickel-responsive transcriptional regulator NikR [Rhodopseudomonas sp. BAL398]WOK19393.1 nickel-responsive transcriptional regulator NikR [Rhodopseudomonas sp. BAL398]